MKILIDTSTIQPQKSGTGKYTDGMLSGLAVNSSIDHIILCGGSPELSGKNQKLLYHRNHNWHKLINFDLLGNHPLIHADAAFFPNYFIPHGFSIPSVATIHDVSFISHPQFYSLTSRKFYQQRIKHTVKYAHHITTVSHHSKSEIIKHLGVPEKMISVIYPGVDVGSRPVNAEKKKQFLYVGNIEPKKNILNMVEGFLNSGLKDYELILIGKNHRDQNYTNRVLDRIKNIDSIRMLGYVTDDSVYDYMSESTAVLNMSCVEGFGIPVLESLALGTPVIISDVPAMREITGDHAVIVNPNDIKSIVDGFNSVINHDLNSVVKKAESVRKNNTWQKSSDQLLVHLSGLKKSQTPSLFIPDLELSDEENSILIPGIYSGIFNSPILKSDLYKTTLYQKMTVERFNILLQILSLKFPEKITIDGEYVIFSPCRQSVDDRLKNIEANKKYLKENSTALWLLSKLPFVKRVYFSGGTAHANNQGDKDIDLFIVASNYRVWIAYTMLRLLYKFVPSFRPMCLNYFVDESSLEISFQQDFYTAHQIAYLKPLNDNSAKHNMISYNSWIAGYFPNMAIEPEQTKIKPFNKWDILSLINLFMMHLWISHFFKQKYKNNSGGIMLDAHRIKLHSNDHRPAIYKRFTSAISAYKLTVTIPEEVKADV